jgi:alpha-ketoglutarate-dependent taurine dioxygenase
MEGALGITALPIDGELATVEVIGLDPSAHVNDAAVAAWLRELLWHYGVFCIRLGAKLDDDGMRAVVQMFGPIKDPVGHDVDGNSVRYSDERQIIDSGFVLTDELRESLGDVAVGGDDLRPGLFQYFHTDDSYVECPAHITVLHARALPSGGGGDTSFIDMRAAYDLLDEDVRARLVGLSAEHAYNNHDAFAPRPSATGDLERLVPVSHPVVRAHPATGRPALYFDLDRATHISGLPDDEGRALLQSLQDHAERRGPRYAHTWRANDVLVWDNASVQHRAIGDFEVGEPRRFWRYMVAGPRPAPYTLSIGHTTKGRSVDEPRT